MSLDTMKEKGMGMYISICTSSTHQPPSLQASVLRQGIASSSPPSDREREGLFCSCAARPAKEYGRLRSLQVHAALRREDIIYTLRFTCLACQ